jgi:hypothetical protein
MIVGKKIYMPEYDWNKIYFQLFYQVVIGLALGTPNPKSFGFGLSLSQKSEIEGTGTPVQVP